MIEITPTHLMSKEAAKLKIGKIIVCYKDNNAIRIETDKGNDPYVWRNNTWIRMK
jgi:hypothetical protein